MIKSLWLAAGAILFLSFSYTEMQGSDLWWHIAAGREIVQTRTLWLVDDWSFSAHGGIWRNHEWLADIIYFAWVSVLGLDSLVYWKMLVVVGTFLALAQVLYRQSASLAASFICAGMAIAIAAPFIDIRPHLYTLLFFGLLLLLRLNRPCATWKLALLFLLWVNLHGGFFFGVMALGILLFPWRNLNAEALKSAVVPAVVVVVVCLFNPSGLQSFLFPLTYAFDDSSPFRTLGEWLPPFTPGGIISPGFFWALYGAPIVALSYVIPAVRRGVAVPWEALVLCALTLAMASTSRRFIPLFAMSFALLSAPVLGLLLKKLGEEKYGVALASAALAFAVFRMMPYPLAAGPAYHYLTAQYTYPVDMLDFMQANKITGNLYALYNWGGYIHWRADGDLKVFIDGRADTIYEADTYRDYIVVLAARPGWAGKIDRSGADYFLWPKYGYGGSEKLRALINSGRWEFVYQDSVSVLLARAALNKGRKYSLGPSTPYRDLTIAQASGVRGGYREAVEWATKTRLKIPYHREACNVLFQAHTSLGNASAAEQISRECRSYFPSPQLRR